MLLLMNRWLRAKTDARPNARESIHLARCCKSVNERFAHSFPSFPFPTGRGSGEAFELKTCLTEVRNAATARASERAHRKAPKQKPAADFQSAAGRTSL